MQRLSLLAVLSSATLSAGVRLRARQSLRGKESFSAALFNMYRYITDTSFAHLEQVAVFDGTSDSPTLDASDFRFADCSSNSDCASLLGLQVCTDYPEDWLNQVPSNKSDSAHWEAVDYAKWSTTTPCTSMDPNCINDKHVWHFPLLHFPFH